MAAGGGWAALVVLVAVQYAFTRPELRAFGVTIRHVFISDLAHCLVIKAMGEDGRQDPRYVPVVQEATDG